MFKVSYKVRAHVLALAADKLVLAVSESVDRDDIADRVASSVAETFTSSRYEMQTVRNRAVETLVDAVDTEEIKGDVVEYFADNFDADSVEGALFDHFVDNVDIEARVADRLAEAAEADPVSIVERAALILAERICEAIDEEE